MSRRVIGLVALVVTLALAITACSNKPAAEPTANTPQQVLFLNAGSEPPNLDPQKSTDAVSFEIMNEMLEGLARQNPEGKIEPGSGMAESWDISADGLTWTFHLKDNVLWSDGVPVKAQDFEYAWKRALDPTTASEYAYQLYYLKNGAQFNDPDNTAITIDDVGVKATDDQTLVVTLEVPCAYFQNLIIFPTLFPSRKDIVDKCGDEFAGDPEKMVYNGPFVMTSWRHQAEMTLKKNDQYWDKDSVKLTEIRYCMISDANASINMYEVGQIDRVGLTKDFVKTYKDKGEYVTVPQATAIYIKYNENWADPATGAKPFSNAKVRKAFSYAIDRKNLCANILSPGARPAYGYVPFGIPGISPDKDFRSEAGDMMDASLDGNGEEAKKLLNEGLAELGLTSFPNGVVFLGGDQNPAAITRMQYFQEQWRTRLGVEVAIDSPDFKTRLEKCSSGNYQMVWEIWGGDYNDPMTFMDLWTTESSQNQCGFTSKDYDTYIQTAKSTADQTVRMDAMHKAEQILADEMPITWLYFPGGNAAVKPWLSGYLDWPVGAAPEYKWAVVDTAKRGY